MSRSLRACAAAACLLACPRLEAKPPLESEALATETSGRAQLYLGEAHSQHTASGIVRREIPSAVLSLGLSEREEITASVPYLSVDGHRGLGDVRLGTKYMVNYSDKRDSGLAAAFNVKLRNGDQSRELGTGAVDYEGRVVAQESWGKNVSYVNFAHTWVGAPRVNGSRQLRHNLRLVSVAEETSIAKKTTFISEMLWSNSEIPDQPYRLWANTGVRYALTRNIELHGTVGRSLREANAGGPQLRAYAGLKLEFASLPPDQ